jgi:hypothetical protein
MLPPDESVAMTPRDDDFDPLDDRQAELEARFRELERDAEIERLRAQGGAPREKGQGSATREKGGATPRGGSEATDPLAEMKQRLDRDPADAAPVDSEEGERFLLVLCPSCQAKNRMSLTRVRTGTPICGGCRAPLSFARR